MVYWQRGHAKNASFRLTANSYLYFMRKVYFVLLVLVTAVVGAIVGSMLTLRYFENQPRYTSITERQQMALAPVRFDSSMVVPKVNFRPVATEVIKTVVHVRISTGPGEFSVNPLDHYLNSPARSSGSGVIVTDDGYIITNYHVIEDARNVEVVLSNNQKFPAKIIGTDPTTDLALLKIKTQGLPYLRYGNSDNIVAGEWVLAVGNPFDLNSTVTAGIVSGKARNIGILADRNNLQIEAFIQTDAAVNPGNSGGALVNLKGELIGVNSAIATTTGAYSGYSFAIPVNLVKKVMDDLLEFGQVQRALLGIQIRDVTADLAESLEINRVNGVFVSYVNKGSTAEEAGIVPGDVITAIDQTEVGSVSELQERVARYRPGKKVMVTFLRDGYIQSRTALLRNFDGEATHQKRIPEVDLDGADLADLPHTELKNYRVESGVLLKTPGEGRWKKAGIESNFIIRFLDKVPVDNIADLKRMLEYKKGGVLIEGVYTTGQEGTYGVAW